MYVKKVINYTTGKVMIGQLGRKGVHFGGVGSFKPNIEKRPQYSRALEQ